jgi:DNA-binding transcriptional ArsR family regulator
MPKRAKSISSSKAVKVAKALGDPTRWKLVQALVPLGEVTCSELCERFPQSQPTMSHHMKTLCEAGLIRVRKQGQFHLISVDREALALFAGAVAPAGVTAR